jgi:hypothetical protein
MRSLHSADTKLNTPECPSRYNTAWQSFAGIQVGTKKN